MKNFDAFEFYQYMEEHNIIISFKGEISQELLVSIGDLLKEKLSQKDTKQQVVKKLFFIFIELGQNIYRYSSEHNKIKENEVGIGVLFIKEAETHFTVFAGNVVSPEAATEIVEQCSVINPMTPDELKRYYKEQMKQPRQEGKVGAGVGLISIVRKANNPIQVHTRVMNEKETFLVLSIEVNKE